MATLRAWYKKHTPAGSGRGTRVQMLVVNCPKHGKVCAVRNVCRVKKPEGDHVVLGNCEHWGGFVFGAIICKHPKAQNNFS